MDYVILDELKKLRRIATSDTVDDESLQRAVNAANQLIDGRCGRTFGLADTATGRVFRPRGRVLSDPDGERLLVDDIGHPDGLVVDVGDGAAWTPVTDYDLLPDNAHAKGEPVTGLLRPYGTWAGRKVRVTARWGWPTVPDDIRQAALLLASRLWLRRDSPEGVAGATEWGVVRVSRLDPDVESLISPYVLPGFA
ncbi:head-tail connector protein [Micromonospora sp. RTGN7]|uniref:head-tail connector protein n=1 Tax=Micromonospora sp. RTGN7 TaxID=3016526 RepID=UPI0029FF01F8|nr:head-tail connector protein [Micromonospora sp. RTGN7]